MALPRSIERGARTLGGMALAAFGPQIPVLMGMITATIPPAHAVWIGPIISLGLKELRMRFPENAILKYFPA